MTTPHFEGFYLKFYLLDLPIAGSVNLTMRNVYIPRHFKKTTYRKFLWEPSDRKLNKFTILLLKSEAHPEGTDRI